MIRKVWSPFGPPKNSSRSTHPAKLKTGIAKSPKMPKTMRMTFTVTLDRDEDGVWIAECPSIPGCVSQGDSREAALENVQEAITLCLEVRAERGMPLTIETKQVEVAV